MKKKSIARVLAGLLTLVTLFTSVPDISFAFATENVDETVSGNVITEEEPAVTETPAETPVEEPVVTEAPEETTVSDGNAQNIVVEKTGEVVLDQRTISTSYDGKEISISGKLPEGAEILVSKVSYTEDIKNNIADSIDGYVKVVVYEAYDITISYNGEEFQPNQFDETVNVSIKNIDVEDKSEEELKVFHIDDSNNIEEVSASVSTEQADFTAASFSVYALTGVTYVEPVGEYTYEDGVMTITSIPEEGPYVWEEDLKTARVLRIAPANIYKAFAYVTNSSVEEIDFLIDTGSSVVAFDSFNNWTNLKYVYGAVSVSNSFCINGSDKDYMDYPIYFEDANVRRMIEDGELQRLQLIKFTFDPKNGKEEIFSKFVREDEIDTMEIPVPAELPYDMENKYYFAYWKLNNMTSDYFQGEEVCGNVTLEAYYAGKYCVTFNLGMGKTTDQYVTPGQCAVKPADPELENNVFYNWYTDATYTKKFDFTTPITKAMTIYAKYLYIATVKFNTDVGNQPADQKVTAGGYVTEPEMSNLENLIFDGWYTNNTCIEKFDFTKQTSLDFKGCTLYAKWVQKNAAKYTVKFVFDADTATQYTVTGNTQLKVDAGATVEAPIFHADSDDEFGDTNVFVNSNTHRVTYIDYWCSDIGLTKKFDFSTPIVKDTNVYAHYIEKQETCQLNFETFGGTEIPSLTLNYNTLIGEIFRPDAPEREHYDFTNFWYTDEACTQRFLFGRVSILKDTTLYAGYTPKVYDVIYVSRGEVVNKTRVKYNQKAPTFDATFGWDTGFLGWQRNGVDYDFDTPVDSNMVLVANWTKKTPVTKYLVRFDSDGGSSVAGKYVEKNSNVIAPADPEKADYLFMGWKLDGEDYDFGTPVTDNITLKAKWVPEYCTVSFVTNFEGTLDDEIVEYGQTVPDYVQDAFYRDDYDFIGWSLESTEELAQDNMYDFDTPVYEDITLYAYWKQKGIIFHNVEVDYEVTEKDFEYGVLGIETIKEYVNPVEKSVTVKSLSDPTLVDTVPPRTEYITDESYTYPETAYYTSGGKKSVSFYAWTTYNYLDNGYNHSEMLDGIVYLDEVYESMDLYPIWVVNMASITFAFYHHDLTTSNPGVDFRFVPYSEYNYCAGFNQWAGIPMGAKLKVPDITPTRDGYTFQGWYKVNNPFGVLTYPAGCEEDMEDSPYDFNTTIEANEYFHADDMGYYIDALTESPYTMVITALWEPKETVDVEFYLDEYEPWYGSEGQYGGLQVYTGDKLEEPDEVPERYGYRFVGWHFFRDLLQHDNSLVRVIEDDEYDFNKTIEKSEYFEDMSVKKTTYKVNLMAEWEIENPVTITFDTNGGTPAIDSETIPMGYTVEEPDTTDLQKEHYIFNGWLTEDEFYWSFYSDAVTEDITLYAEWIPETYSVDFDSDGGSSVERQDIEYNQTAEEPAAPSKTGFTFVGWYVDDEAFDFDTPITDNVTLKAKWLVDAPAVVTYKVTFNSNGGSEVAEQEVIKGNKAVEPANPVKANYVFKGWYKDSEFKDMYNFEDKVLDNCNLFAKWEKETPVVISYKVTFNSNGGTKVAEQNVVKGNKATEPAVPSKKDYTFKGWYKDSEFKVVYDFDNAVTSSIELFAKWEKVEAAKPTPAPEVPTPAPEVPTPAPEVPTPAPEVPTPAPEVPTPAPEVPTPAPEVPTPAPEVPTTAPEVKPTEKPTETPAPTVKPTEKPTATPEVEEEIEIIVPTTTPTITPSPVVPTETPAVVDDEDTVEDVEETEEPTVTEEPSKPVPQIEEVETEDEPILTQEIIPDDATRNKSAMGRFMEGVKKVAVVVSIGLAALLGILGLLLLLLAWMRRVKVLNDQDTDEYSEDKSYKVVYKTSIKNEDSNFIQDLFDELLGREKYTNWKITVPEEVINDEITKDYKVVINKGFAKRHNGEDLMIIIEDEEDNIEIPVTLFEEQTEYEFHSAK